MNARVQVCGTTLKKSELEDNWDWNQLDD